MNRHQPPAGRRAGPLFGVLLVIAGAVGALTPAVPTVRAQDPTPAAEPTPTPEVEPTAAPTFIPRAAPTPTPTPAPTATPVEEPSPSAEPSGEPSAEPSSDPSAEPTPEPSATAEPAGLRLDHGWIDTVDDAGAVIDPGQLDTPLQGAQRFTVYRVRFQVVNSSDSDATVKLVLEMNGGSDGWTVLPMVDPEPGTAFYGASDDGRVFDPRRATIAVADLRLGEAEEPGATPVEGAASAGRTLATLELPANTFTEVEFAIRATSSAAWETGYRFRLSDGTDALPGARAELVMGAKPEVDLSPGQRKGKPVDEPVPLYRLDPAIGSTDMPLASSVGTGTTAAYALRTPVAAIAPEGSPHVISGLASDACASCHGAHDAQGSMLLQGSGPQSSTCFTCHDGTGAATDVQSQWSSSSLPANDPATASWYSHPATEPSSHVSAQVNEFEGTLDRHAACADCHQPHLADGSRPLNSVGGWSASGSIAGASGVAVVNGDAGTAPAYTLQQTSDFEYQLCFKCHSGFTELPAQDPAHPSRWSLDKGIELNPANVSYHPVEAAGKNQTSAMTASLAGTSPYKLWVFETQDTVRCESCHGNSSTTTQTPRPVADASLDNHASPNRGILIAPYRDRTLKPRGPYAAQDFALCYVCHAEAPMVDDSGDLRDDTNFNWHGYHLGSISGNGLGGTDIDVPGAGPGNSLCAECHFRIHGSALAVNGQAPATGLVNFAPNVQKLGGALEFKAATPTSLGTCTLVCHGKAHNAYGYD